MSTNDSATSFGIVDDHKIFCEGLRHIIHSLPGYRVLFTAHHGKDMQEKLQGGLVPNFILLDLQMPVMNGMAAMEWLHVHHPEVKVIVISQFASERCMVKLFGLGAHAFLAKEKTADELRRTVGEIKEKGFSYADHLTRRLLGVAASGVKQGRLAYLHMTKEEERFLQLASGDATYVFIAHRMQLTVKQVDKLREKLFEKFCVTSRVSLIAEAFRQGVIMET